MKITKKHILYGSIVTISTAAIVIAGSLAFQAREEQVDKPGVNTAKDIQSNDTPEVDVVLKKAEAARSSKQYDEAADLYRQARAHYEQTNDIEKMAELDAVLSLLDVEKGTVAEPVKPKLAGER